MHREEKRQVSASTEEADMNANLAQYSGGKSRPDLWSDTPLDDLRGRLGADIPDSTKPDLVHERDVPEGTGWGESMVGLVPNESLLHPGEDV